jgi:hypothetical protein
MGRSMSRLFEVTVDVEGSRRLSKRLTRYSPGMDDGLGPIVGIDPRLWFPPDRDVEGRATWRVMVEADRAWEACQAGLQYLGDEWPELRELLLDARGFQVRARPW